MSIAREVPVALREGKATQARKRAPEASQDDHGQSWSTMVDDGIGSTIWARGFVWVRLTFYSIRDYKTPHATSVLCTARAHECHCPTTAMMYYGYRRL